jgi:hypothetical protein
MGWSDDAAENRALWTTSNAEYTDRKALEAWSCEPSRGTWDIPDAERGVFGGADAGAVDPLRARR